MTPKMAQVDLTVLQDSGVLMAANERFFWPLGLALTWMHEEDGTAHSLHVTEWNYGDGHQESIGLEADDTVALERRQKFAEWFDRRLGTFTIKSEIDAAQQLREPPSTPVVYEENYEL